VCDLETSRMGVPYIYDISHLRVNNLTLILLTWKKWWAPNNASKQQMGFNSAFKGLTCILRSSDQGTSSCFVQFRHHSVFLTAGFPIHLRYRYQSTILRFYTSVTTSCPKQPQPHTDPPASLSTENGSTTPDKNSMESSEKSYPKTM